MKRALIVALLFSQGFFIVVSVRVLALTLAIIASDVEFVEVLN